MRSSHILACSIALFSCACGRQSESLPAAQDAGLAAPSVSRAHAAIASTTAYGGRLAAAEALDWQTAAPVPGALSALSAALEVHAPETSDAPLALRHRELDGATLSLTAQVASVAGRPLGVAREFVEVAPQTDMVLLRTQQYVEELRVLHGVGAPTHFSWKGSVGAAIAEARVRDGRIELLDARGVLRFGTPPLDAVDARGLRRSLAVHLERSGEELAIDASLDTAGMTYPIVVDPLWTTIGSMAVKRGAGALVGLGNGRALAAGGYDTTVSGTPPSLSSAELFDVSTRVWTTVAPMAAARQASPAFRLFSGAGGLPQVLMVGGLGGSSAPSAEKYDPVTNKWSFVATPLSEHDANPNVTWTTLGGGLRALVVDTASEVYNPASNSWSATANGPSISTLSTPIELPNGDAMLLGGNVYFGSIPYFDQVTVQYFTDSTRTFSGRAALPIASSAPYVETLPVGPGIPAGGLLLLGGALRTNRTTAMFYDIAADSWQTLLPLPDTRGGPLARLGAANHIYALGASYITSMSYPALSWSRVGPAGTSGAYQSAKLNTTSLIYCNSGVCEVFQLYGQGNACTSADECATGNCVDGVCCASASCTGGTVCNGPKNPGVCSLLLGQKCTTNASCDSGFCADGVCCASACSGVCQRCDALGSAGTCTPVVGAPKASHGSCPGSTDVCKSQTCNGVDGTACHFPAGATKCGAASCSKDVVGGLGVCDGKGNCNAVSTSCGAFHCNAAGTSCISTCTADTDCVSGFHCDTGNCVPKTSLGQTCTAPSDCTSGLFCTNGVCCGVADCGASWTCNYPGKTAGVCLGDKGGTCASDADCGSGVCADGVCCNARCDGPCESCATPSAVGVCTPIAGKAIHAGCGAGDGTACGGPLCDGTDGTKCAAFVGADVICRPASCTAGSRTNPATCDGKGACPAEVTLSCNGYACAADGVSCLRSCKADTDCASGHRCARGSCIVPTSTCSQDLTAATATDGSVVACAPYLCRAGSCLGSCASSEECAVGFTCASSTSTCVAPPTSRGGCSTSRGGSSTAGLWALGVAIAGLYRRRRVGAALASALLLGGCKGGASSEANADAGAAPVSSARDATVGRIEAAFPRFAGRLPLTASASNGALGRSIPRSPQAATKIWNGGDNGVWLEVTPLQIGEGTESSDPTTVVHRDVAQDTDVVRASLADGVEEWRVLRSERAPTSFRWRLRASRAIADRRIREGYVELLDANGRVAFVAQPLEAVDANGVHRALRVGLVGEELVASIDVRGLQFPVVVDPLWSNAPAPPRSLASSTGIVLPDQRVMFVGGAAGGTSQIYDNTTNTWSNGPTLLTPRSNAMLATLAGTPGQLVVTGGVDVGGTALSSTELWSVGAASFTAGAAAPAPMLAFGGRGSRVFGVSSNVGYSFDGSSWHTVTGATVTNAGTIMGLPDGRVLSCGGMPFGQTVATCTTYTPTTDALTAGPDMPNARDSFAFAVDTDKLIVVGGTSTQGTHFRTTTDVVPVDVFDYATSAWSTSTSLLHARSIYAFVAPIASHRYLIGGGKDVPTATAAGFELLDLTSGSMIAGGATPSPLGGPAFTLNGTGALVQGTLVGVPYFFRPAALGTSCASGIECASFACVDGVCCGSTSCPGGGVCNAPGLAGSCAKPTGLACASSTECVSGQCVDGFCCNSSCTGECEACDVPGVRGTCTPVAGPPHGARTACAAATAAAPCAGQICNGTDRTTCHFPASGTVLCGTASCSGGTETHVSTCDGAGKCQDTPRSCGLYACDSAGTLCNAKCAADADCATGSYCDVASGGCKPLAGLGTRCTTASTCAKGEFCTDGVCCASASCGTGTCAAGIPGKLGLCTKANGDSCAASDECTSRQCVDGVCCNSVCNGQCEACDVATAIGTCTAVSGTPHGSRPTCSAGDGKCGKESCDGSVRTSCAGRPGTSTSCGDAACLGDSVLAAASCDGKGKCVTSSPADCKGYACDSTSKACKTSCTTDGDCASGFACASSVCVARSSKCSDDGLSVVDAKGATTACSPYYCADAICGVSCTTTTDCQPGFQCASDSHCAPVSTGAAAVSSSGGCATTTQTSSGRAWWLLGLGLLGLVRRQRRAR